MPKDISNSKNHENILDQLDDAQATITELCVLLRRAAVSLQEYRAELDGD